MGRRQPYIIFGQARILKRNPWLSGSLRELVLRGLATTKKDYILAAPPPWFRDPSKLSPAQIYQVMRFATVRMRHTGKGSLAPMMEALKKEASGPVPATIEKRKTVRPFNMGVVITIAKALNVPVPKELEEKVSARAATTPVPTTATPPGGIRP
jgi:hypothetical protein